MTRSRAAWLAALLLALFLADAVLIAAGLTLGIDDRLLRLGRQADVHHGFGGGAAMLHGLILLTDLGGAWVRAPVTIVAAIALLALGRRREGLLLALATTLGAGAVELVKLLAHRARPDAAWRLVDVIHASFPSGHAAGSMTLYPLLGLAIGRAIGGETGWTIAGVALALAIGATRVLLGVHWASDVAGGWLFGGAFALVAAALAGEIRRGA